MAEREGNFEMMTNTRKSLSFFRFLLIGMEGGEWGEEEGWGCNQ